MNSTFLPGLISYIFDSFLHIWPFLIISVPAAILLRRSGKVNQMRRVISGSPVTSVLLATMIGAFSPFCSCSVIPVISSLLISGVPVAPVMSFWLASPTMDPEIFFLSAGLLGWKLAAWRLASTFLISLSGGLLLHYLIKRGVINGDVLRTGIQGSYALTPGTGASAQVREPGFPIVAVHRKPGQPEPEDHAEPACQCSRKESQDAAPGDTPEKNGLLSYKHWKTVAGLITETANSLVKISLFMALAFTLNYILQEYLPGDALAKLLSGYPGITVILSALAGIPLYTSNLAALPIAAGLLKLGISQGAVLAFLISGSATTLPALAAVYGIVKARIFLYYLLVASLGSMTAGWMMNLFNG